MSAIRWSSWCCARLPEIASAMISRSSAKMIVDRGGLAVHEVRVSSAAFKLMVRSPGRAYLAFGDLMPEKAASSVRERRRFWPSNDSGSAEGPEA